MDELGLAAAVRALRAELLESRAEGEDGDLRFELGELTVELKAAISKSGNGKLGWKIIEVGGSVGSEATQTITLTLTPYSKNPKTGQYESAPMISASLDSGASPNSGGENGSHRTEANQANQVGGSASSADDDGPVRE